ncbi:MAG: proline dehydrogenase family protein [Bacteroidetes bacterium]|jgi:proline dehydrogenase|nr:proline dehydrogenase family protein [Bacteroidota bacterium]
MGMMRNALLWASQSPGLRRTLPRYRFVRRAVRRFMPGEDLESALRAAEELRAAGIASTFTRLGENVTNAEEANGVRDHYLTVADQVKRRGLDTHISTKLTQLGLDIDPDLAYRGMRSITEKAARLGQFTWIDMEQSSYVEVTLEIFKRIHAAFPNIGICLQSYLRRTPKDLDSLMEAGAAVRMVKGAYKEPPSVAFPEKSEVDEAFFRLCADYLKAVDRTKAILQYGTHDLTLVRRIAAEAERLGLQRTAPEFTMLYGIQTGEQRRLAAKGYRMRVLVAYGEYWFPWYMRRLAERPANVWFVVRNILP